MIQTPIYLTNHSLFTYDDTIVQVASLVKQLLLVKEKIFRTTMRGMKLAKLVREFAGLNPWNMSKEMDKNIQSYVNFERKAKRITLGDFYKLESIYLKHGGTKEKFDEMAREHARKEK